VACSTTKAQVPNAYGPNHARRRGHHINRVSGADVVARLEIGQRHIHGQVVEGDDFDDLEFATYAMKPEFDLIRNYG
jgi:hypothetical protein